MEVRLIKGGRDRKKYLWSDCPRDFGEKRAVSVHNSRHIDNFIACTAREGQEHCCRGYLPDSTGNCQYKSLGNYCNECLR